MVLSSPLPKLTGQSTRQKPPAPSLRWRKATSPPPQSLVLALYACVRAGAHGPVWNARIFADFYGN